MKNLMNHVDTIRDESLDGFAAAHADIVALGPDREYIRRKNVRQGKVALISGGGAGHEPLHIGFVGYGMLDAACPGQIFTSPTPNQMINAANAVDGGAGIAQVDHHVGALQAILGAAGHHGAAQAVAAVPAGATLPAQAANHS